VLSGIGAAGRQWTRAENVALGDFIKGRARVVVSMVVGGVISYSNDEVAHNVHVLTVLMCSVACVISCTVRSGEWYVGGCTGFICGIVVAISSQEQLGVVADSHGS
jgi:hypothetical protein